MQLHPGDSIGRYQVQKTLGSGGFANVYMAFDPALHRMVAIKVPRHDVFGDDGDWLRERLLNEARILAELQHPAILTVFDVGEERGVPFMAIEQLEGTLPTPARDVTSARPHARAIETIASTADALDYVHRRGYLHRNLKPNAIFMDRTGRSRLAGFSAAISKEALDTADSIGTLWYMPPEQLRDGTLGPRTDIFALGVTLFQALTGHRPFEATSLGGLLSKMKDEALPPSSLDPSIPEALDRICLKCVALDPALRYGDASLLAADLRGLSLAAPPPRPPRVFISHATADREFVEREVVDPLERNGIQTWYSRVDIQSAADWERSIVHGLESCEWFLVVMSPRSLASDWVKDELHWAIDRRPGRILPVLMEACDARGFHIRLSRIQHLDFSTPSREARAGLLSLLGGAAP